MALERAWIDASFPKSASHQVTRTDVKLELLGTTQNLQDQNIQGWARKLLAVGRKISLEKS
jgi:hypothetical protein